GSLAEYAAVKVAYWSEAEPLDVLLARGDRAGARRLLAEQVVPRMSLLAPPGREAAQNVLDDLLSILG
ncbi:MAG: hypothetical protein WCH13_08585, partial [Deltaproteobacteria bacterium]